MCVTSDALVNHITTELALVGVTKTDQNGQGYFSYLCLRRAHVEFKFSFYWTHGEFKFTYLTSLDIVETRSVASQITFEDKSQLAQLLIRLGET